MVVALRAKASLKGKDKLPLISRILADPRPDTDLARFRRNEELETLTATQLYEKILMVLGESPDALLGVVKVDKGDKEGLVGVAHHVITLADGALDSQTPVSPPRQASIPKRPAEDGDSSTGAEESQPLTKRVRELEQKRQRERVDDTLRQDMVPQHELTAGFQPERYSTTTGQCQAWVNWKGKPAMSPPPKVSQDFCKIQQVASGEVFPDLASITFPDPKAFIAGGIHSRVSEWEKILTSHPQKDEIMEIIRHGASVPSMFCPFKGAYKGELYDCPTPPKAYFPNSPRCAAHIPFIVDTLHEKLQSGAMSVWGKVGECTPPHLVLPLTVEESKPRLCHDERFLNLWIKDQPFKLDTLADVPRMLHEESLLTHCDEKNGYENVCVTQDSRPYLGVQFGGCYLVYNVLPFGFKGSAFVYHSLGMAPTQYARALGVNVLQYIDDRLIADIPTLHVQYTVPQGLSDTPQPYLRSLAATFVVCFLLVALGYYVHLDKSSLDPKPEVDFLGMTCCPRQKAFKIPASKKQKFAELREFILGQNSVGIRTIQKFTGKCVSFSAAIPSARLYTRELNAGISRGLRNSQNIPIKGPLKSEVEFWRFIDLPGSEISPWLDERHQVLGLSTDASIYAWGAYWVGSDGRARQCRDYFTADQMGLPIGVKEALALCKAIESFSLDLMGVRICAQVDNQSLIAAWNNMGSKSVELSRVIKMIVATLVKINSTLQLSYVPSANNPADAPSRSLSLQEATLEAPYWSKIQEVFGGPLGHSVDLMASESNVMLDLHGKPLKFYSRFPCPGSSGVNLFAQSISQDRNPYIFPPFSLIPVVLRFLRQQNVTCTVLVPKLHPLPFWWPGLVSLSQSNICVAAKGAKRVLQFPSKVGYTTDQKGLVYHLYAFRFCPSQSAVGVE